MYLLNFQWFIFPFAVSPADVLFRAKFLYTSFCFFVDVITGSGYIPFGCIVEWIANKAPSARSIGGLLFPT